MAVEVDAIECHAIDDIAIEAESFTTSNDVPKWLNTDFVQKHLRQFYDNQEIRVIQADTNLATAKGDNYASCIYRVKVLFAIDTDNDEVRVLLAPQLCHFNGNAH